MQLSTLLLVLATQISSGLSQPTEPRSTPGKVLYIEDNNPAGSSIIAYKISPDNGKLSDPVRTSTGGKGRPFVVAASQDSLKVSGNYLFAVNEGSDTLSFFYIDPKDPQHPRLVGKPAHTLGTTPISVAYSEALKTACVLNGDPNGSITCFSVDPKQGLKALGPTRPLPYPANATVPTTGPPFIPRAEVRFDPSSKALFTTQFVASNTSTPGDVIVFPVKNGQVSHTSITNSLSEVQIPFSINFLGSDKSAFLTNPHGGSPGAAFLDISPNFDVSVTDIVTIPGQVASCWAAYAPAYNSLIVSDAARPEITVVDVKTRKSVTQFHVDQNVGVSDSAILGRYFYTNTVPVDDSLTAYTESPELLVYDVSPISSGKPPSLVQRVNVEKTAGKLSLLTGLKISFEHEE